MGGRENAVAGREVLNEWDSADRAGGTVQDEHHAALPRLAHGEFEAGPNGNGAVDKRAHTYLLK
ncbi:hypothetical protein [Streptomyces sp. A1277]|uniref:hypothetical protein n=1 Tax=Streptomyces sp. A1277 TaxID=2563103 RepID=UPI001F0DD27E|nr:hypothetical protein [Streptomyces sp. A1277]